MRKLTRNEWIAVSVTLVVGVIFFATSDFISTVLQSSKEINPNKAQVMGSSIDNSLDNSFDSSVAGFQIEDIVIGTGEEAVVGKTLVVNYTGAFTDGRVFDSSVPSGKPLEFVLGAGQVIQGWDKGFAGMKVGGKRQLVVPSDYGYGPAGMPPVIPPNATLVFEVELLGVK